METIKSFTDLQQSRKLAEILPLESADMAYYFMKDSGHLVNPSPFVLDGTEVREDGIFTYLNCWSLVALLDILPNCTDIVKEEADTENEKYMCTVGVKDDIISTFGNNPVDACYEMILKLKEKNLL